MANRKELPTCLHEKCGINILYPHFANTYLLPFYAENNKLLEDYGMIKLIEYRWNPNDLKVKLTACKDEDTISIFYGTDDLYKNSTRNLRIARKIIKATFSTYVPRFIFIPFDIKLFDKFYKNKQFGGKKLEDFNQPLKAINEPNNLKKLIPSFSEIKGEFQSYSGCNFFSDTIPQSEQIEKKITSLNVFGNEGNKIKILYYSASYSMYLFNLYPEYLPIYLDILEEPNKVGLMDFFKTNNYIYCKHKNNCSLGAKNCDLKRKVELFHIQIFNDAKNIPNNLTDVYLDYVSKDFKKIPFHILQDVDSFSKAITFHHLYPKNENEIKIKGRTLKKLVEEYNEIINEDFNESLKAFLSTSKSLFFILILDYWTQKLNSIKFDDIEKYIPQLLLEKSFLSGKYYFLYKELFKLSYNYFILTIPEINRINEIKIICPEISDNDIFSFYYDWVMKDISKLRYQNKEEFLENIKISFDFIEKITEIKKNKELKTSFDDSTLIVLFEIKKLIEKNVTQDKYPTEINTKLKNLLEANTATIDKR